MPDQTGNFGTKGIETLRRYGLRALILLLCVAAWADLRPLAGAAESLPIAVIDVSDSVGDAPPRLPDGLRARARWVLVADGWQEIVGGAEAVRLPRRATHLGAALRHVAATYPGADVVLISDGRATDSDGASAARAVAAGGGRVFTTAPPDPVADVGLEHARVTARAPRARVEAVVSSSTSGRCEVRLVRDGRVAARADLQLAPGLVQSVELEDATPPAEGTSYHVVLVPAPGTPDDEPADNRLAVGLRPEQRVVLFWGVPEAQMLESGAELVVRVGRVPDAAELEGADCLVLGNLPWREIGVELTRALERFVAGGGRLILLGGPEAYAGGGWAGTLFEQRLAPLRVPRREGTGLAIVLAVDRSGSTRGATLAHLKDAARRALQGLTPGERMAVLPFAGKPGANLLGPGVLRAGGGDEVRDALAALDELDARGDTDLPAAIREAARRVHGIEARERRVILLTDGDPDHPPDEAALASAAAFLAERGVRFGAFVVGDEEAVARLRRHLASGTPEDVQALDDAAGLTDSLLHRVAALRAQPERLPRPARLVAVGAVRPLFLPLAPRAVQRLETAVDAGAEAGVFAEYVDLEPRRVPFAALRRVGAGEVAAMAWGPALEGRADRGPALARLLPWIASLASRSDRGLAAQIEGEALLVMWPAAADRGLISARTARGAADLLEIRPGLFRGPLPPGAETGVRVQWAGAAMERPVRMPSRPAPEQRGSGVDEAALRALAAAGGGRRLAAGEAPPPARQHPGVPLAPWLLLGACILLVVDRLWAKPDTPPADA